MYSVGDGGSQVCHEVDRRALVKEAPKQKSKPLLGYHS